MHATDYPTTLQCLMTNQLTLLLLLLLPPSCDDPESEACAQIVAEYCVDHMEDEGCALVVMGFSRVSNETTSITVHHAGSYVDGQAVFKVAACGCTDTECPPAEVEVLATDYATSSLTVTYHKLQQPVLMNSAKVQRGWENACARLH